MIQEPRINEADTPMKTLLISLAILVLTGCSADPGSEAWCEEKEAQNKSEWTGSDAAINARHCILNSQTIGSKSWCENLSNKPKGDWSSNEAGDYARHCVL